MAELSVSLLGTFEATLDSEPLTQFRTKSVQALFIYLVCEAKRPHQRETLMAMLWPGMPLESAQANLRQTIYRLRKVIPEVRGKEGGKPVPFLTSNRQTIQINPDADYYLDVDVFAVSERAEAIALYRGDFLADFYLPDSEAFEEWAASLRADYRRLVLEMLDGETAVHIQNADYDEAIKLARRQLEIDNLRESGHRQLMEALARNGRRQEALTQYNTLRQLLREELAVEPSQETQALIEKIRADDFVKAARPSQARMETIEPDFEPEPHKHNLPQRITTFIGREKELAAVTKLVSQNRLVMLTGVGGIGKTNLCLQVGRAVLDTFADGVWLVELAPISDPALVAKTAANTLGLRESSDQSLTPQSFVAGESAKRPILQVLLDYLQEKHCLLILDNCEHVIDAAAQFVETLLEACAGVKVLASSREALGVPGEIPYRVPSLSLPDVQRPLQLNDWRQFDGLNLFVERATAVSPEFQVTEDNFGSLVKICQRLDGIPLALELAAARVRVLNTSQIANRLDDRFRLLTGGSRTALPRQQTLRALIDWSWELLTAAEKLLLQRLSVFAGGMSLEAVETVCVGDGLDPYELLDRLDELVNKSLVLVRRESGQELRYSLLETIRQYAQERLLSAGQGAAYRQRHLAYFVALAERAGPALIGPEQIVWRNRLERELDNIRAALNWAQETDGEAGIRLMTAVWRFWERGYVNEGEMWLEQLMAGAVSLPPAVEARAIQVQAIFNFYLTNHDQALLFFEKSLALFQAIGDQDEIDNALRFVCIYDGLLESKKKVFELLPRFRQPGRELVLAEVLGWLGYYEAEQNNYQQARLYLQEAESLYRERGHLSGLADALENFALFAIWEGDYQAAQQALEESYAIDKKLGERGSFSSLHRLGVLYFRLGDYPQALEHLNKSLALTQQSGVNSTGVWTWVQLGYVYLEMGELEEAQKTFTKSLRQFVTIASKDGIGFTLEGFAHLAVRQGEAVSAARLYAAVGRLRKEIHNPRPVTEQADVDKDIAAIMGMIDEAAYDAAFAEGQAMTTEEAVAYALEVNNILEE